MDFSGGLWLLCWIVVVVLDCGCCAGLWLLCWIVVVVLDCGCCAGLWLLCWIVVVVLDCGCCAGFWLLWLMLVHVHVYQVLLLSWRAQAMLHQLSCDLGRGVYVPWKACGGSSIYTNARHFSNALKDRNFILQKLTTYPPL